MLKNGFKIEDIEDLDKSENLDERNRFKLVKSQSDELEQMQVKAIIRQEKEDKTSGNFRYDSLDEGIIKEYRLSDEAKRRNRNVSTEIKLSISCITEDIGQLDKKDKRIFDYTSYKLRFSETNCKSKETFKYIFNSFKEFYSNDPNRVFSLNTTRHDGVIQLEVNFVCWFPLEGFKEVHDKMNEVKSEIENILNVFEIYDYHVILELYA